MPLGLLRLNERTQRPNECINFIKPLATLSEEDQKIAMGFLERIAAQCYPIMKKEYISVMSLEEFPPNPEFLGRNFNAGEAIQLVLKDKAGRWLSFKFVQMVMMHELAHCKQMNHSRYFWQVRNKFAESMQGLWAKQYTGEGVWGRGQDLQSGAFVHDRMPDNADIPEHLCGGTYRRGRGRKRKRGQDGAEKPKVTYAERQQKRIAKKFGKHGEGHGLGEDELVRGALEQGKRHYGKPKVANSKRGRELRANAALARFEAANQQEQVSELQEDDDSETESELSDDEYGDSLPILEKLGEITDGVTDESGRQFFKVDEDGEDDGGEGAQDELRDLQLLNSGADKAKSGDKNALALTSGGDESVGQPLHEDSETESEPEDVSTQQPDDSKTGNTTKAPEVRSTGPGPLDEGTNGKDSWSFASINASGQDDGNQPSAPSTNNLRACPICSLDNNPDSPTCEACGNVLRPRLMPNHWRCRSEQCKGSLFINPGDANRCYLCTSVRPAFDSKPMGVMSSDVLRWD
jgi:hypothetical protein